MVYKYKRKVPERVKGSQKDIDAVAAIYKIANK